MLDAVRPFLDEGFAIHLLKKRSKAPLHSGWSDGPAATEEELDDDYREGMNVGVRLGKPSFVEGMYPHVIDLDIRDDDYADEAHEALREMFPKVNFDRLPTVQSGSRGESRHYYFLSQDPFRSKKLAHSDEQFEDEDGHTHWCWEIELFGTGKQVAMPPSIHPDTGKRYRWLVEPDWMVGIPMIDGEVLSDLVHVDEDREPVDHEPLDMTLDEAREELGEIQDWADDRETWMRVGMGLKYDFGDDAYPDFDEWSQNGKSYDRRENRYQWSTYKNDHKNPVTFRTALAEVRDREYEQAILDEIADMADLDDDDDLIGDVPAEEDDEGSETPKPRPGDPDMSILRQARFPAPEFPLDILHPAWQREVKLIAENASAPVDFVTGGLLAFSGSIIGNARSIEVREGWREPPILWCQIIGSPSSNKSPALSPFVSIANHLEALWEPVFGDEHRKWETEKKFADTKRKQWDAMAAEKIQKGETPDEMPPDCIAPPEPTKRRVYLTDATLEALVRVLAGNDRGFLNYRDEMAGWYYNLARYSQGSDRPAWLEAYGGRPYVVDRVKDGGKPVRVSRFTVGILGGIQPERLLSILDDSDDGLQSRFMPFWPEDAERSFNFGIDKNSYAERALERLSELRMGLDQNNKLEPHIMPMTEKALRVFGNWVDKHNAEERYAPTRLKSTYGKANGHVARIAINLQLLDWAMDDFADDEPEKVGVDAVERAIRFREEYLKPMQKRVFGHGAETDEVRMAKNVAEWIVNSGTEELNARLLRRSGGIPGISSRTDTDRLDDALLYLVSTRWLIPDQKSTDKGGRPKKNYRVNERVWDLLGYKKED